MITYDDITSSSPTPRKGPSARASFLLHVEIEKDPHPDDDDEDKEEGDDDDNLNLSEPVSFESLAPLGGFAEGVSSGASSPSSSSQSPSSSKRSKALDRFEL